MPYDEDRLAELAAPRPVDAATQWERTFLKKSYHTCPKCGKQKSYGGKCKDCTMTEDAKRRLAAKARKSVFSLNNQGIVCAEGRRLSDEEVRIMRTDKTGMFGRRTKPILSNSYFI